MLALGRFGTQDEPGVEPAWASSPQYACVPVRLCACVRVCLCAHVPVCACACVPVCLCARLWPRMRVRVHTPTSVSCGRDAVCLTTATSPF